jgi:ubiquinone/menaquinone biosynthesis C-methylase UbiE
MKSRTPTTILAALCLILSTGSVGQPSATPEDIYTSTKPSRDGIGKLYFGREISQVMGHRGAAWLERRSRVAQELPDDVVKAMALAPDAKVADIGAGTGYFSLRIAPVVPDGRVYAVDIQPEMLAILRERTERRGITNVLPVRGKPDDPMLPAGTIDAVLMVDAYHEFAFPFEMMRGIVRSLRSGGRVYLVEYRGEDPSVPIKPLHKLTQRQAIKELKVVGLQWKETRDFLPTQHFMVFEKPASAGRPHKGR